MEEYEFSKPELVYHYCSVESLISILQSNVLRLTDVFKMNDWSEKQYYGNLVIKYLTEEYHLAENVVQSLHSRLDEIANPSYGYAQAYACCFSENADSLSQWKMYGDNGFGVCIGFDKKTLSKLNSNNSVISFNKVQYPSKLKKRELDSVYKMNTFQFCSDICDYITMFDKLMAAAIYRKHPSYSMEKEWRIALVSEKSYCGLISLIDPIDQLNEEGMVGRWQNKYFNISKPKTIARNNIIQTFYELNFSLVKNELIKQIVIGPASPNSEIDVFNALITCGYDNRNVDDMLISKTRYDSIRNIIIVNKSNIPYRG